MSLVVFAGSAQFASVSTLAAGNVASYVGTKDVVNKYVRVSSSDLPEYAAASAELTAAATVDPNEGE